MLTRKRDAYLLAVDPAVFASLLVLSFCLEAQAQPKAAQKEPFSEASPRYFTVKDSIEMARFERGGGQPIFSPDGKYFAVVTSRGIIDRDEVESTLQVFNSEEVKEFLRSGDVDGRVVPRVIARLAAVPKVDYVNSYEPIISSGTWSNNSKALLFLSQNSAKERQLYQADLISGSVRALTPGGYDVMQFGVGGRTIAYRMARSGQSPGVPQAINADAFDITGVSLSYLLFGERTVRYPPYSELWVHRNGQNLRVTGPSTKRPVRLSNSPPVNQNLNPLSVSPDDRFVVALVPANSIPKSWESYVPGVPSVMKKLDSKDPSLVADSNYERPTQYALIDLNDGKEMPLMDAPNGWALGYADWNLAVWSSSGKKLLLGNTYLPLDGVDESESRRRLLPCAAAVVDLTSRTSSCVTFTRGRNSSSLFTASFGDNENEVFLRFWQKSAEERYSYEGGAWQLIPLATEQQPRGPSKGAAAKGHASRTFSVEIKQDLNTPPALWVTDKGSGRSKRIWDPNPQLREFAFGEASVFHWKDPSGHEWTSGLVKPPDYVLGQRYPLVIQTHGFIADEFMSDGQYTTAFAARPLAAAGMVVLHVPDMHDHQGTAGEAPDHIIGYEAAIDALASEGLIDPQKVGIIGFSRTSYYVESALIQSPTRYAAATIADGVDESYMQALLFFNPAKLDGAGEGDTIYGGKPFGEGLKLWMDRAPGFHLDRVRAPVRIETHGPWSILGEWEIYASLWRQGKPVDLIQIPDGQHILQKPLERMASQQGSVDWFRFWLKGEEDTDPAKAQQYARWRELRKLQEQSAAKPHAAPAN